MITPTAHRASFTASTDAPRLTRRTRSSFTTTDVPATTAMLRQHGYADIATRSPYEAARLVQAGGLAVIYTSGSVLVQGSNPAPLVALLDAAAAESAVR